MGWKAAFRGATWLTALLYVLVSFPGSAAETVTNYWEAEAGGFHHPGNWRDPWVPGPDATVCFERAGTSRIGFARSVTNYGAQIGSRAIAAGRDVVFDLGGNAWVLSGEHYSAFSVGRGAATVRVRNGTLATHSIWLRGDATALILSGANTEWNILSWGAVGYNDARPLLRIEDGARVSMGGSLQVPRAGGSGFVEVTGAGSVLAARLFVGYAAGSRGELTVADGARLVCPANLEIAHGIGSYGVLTIDGGRIEHRHAGGWGVALRGNSVLRVVLRTGQTDALIRSASDIVLDGGVFELRTEEGFRCAVGDTFTVMEPAAGKGFIGDGVFANLPEGGLISADGFVFKAGYTGGENANRFTLTRIER